MPPCAGALTAAENSPMLEGEDDFYVNFFFASIAFENPGLDR